MKNAILMFLIPQFLGLARSLAYWLRFKDVDDIGPDDIAADAIDAAITLVEKYLKPPTDTPLDRGRAYKLR